ncbi:hypothetical protein [Arthrobacter sp. NA-172]|uniref:hypothetical protein n=1 Tax=Arthrobacter sp. NA-172 TaxID=3367524 RepID=UPI003754EA86
MTTPKKPQDYKSKTSEVSECFSFDHDGETYTFKPTLESITPGFLRKHRNGTDLDVFFTIIELIADEDTLAVIDNLSHKEFDQLSTDFFKHLGAQRGE